MKQHWDPVYLYGIIISATSRNLQLDERWNEAAGGWTSLSRSLYPFFTWLFPPLFACSRMNELRMPLNKDCLTVISVERFTLLPFGTVKQHIHIPYQLFWSLSLVTVLQNFRLIVIMLHLLITVHNIGLLEHKCIDSFDFLKLNQNFPRYNACWEIRQSKFLSNLMWWVTVIQYVMIFIFIIYDLKLTIWLIIWFYFLKLIKTFWSSKGRIKYLWPCSHVT